MTTFVVSLFLPYTINFNSSTPQRKPRSPPQAARRGSAAPTAAQLSLLANPTPPDSPDDEPTPFGPQLDPSSPAFHFAKPHDPRSLARSDAHVPDWGHGRIFNQPAARRSIAPPSTVLQYAIAQDQVAAAKLQRLQSQQKSRDASRDKRHFGADWAVEPAIQGNGGLTNAVQAAADQGILEHKYHVGTLGFPTDALDRTRRDEIEDTLENEYDSLTVITEDNDFDGHYTHYCKRILWPVLHYQIPDHPKSKAYEDHSWVYYVKVNQAFADKVIRSYKHGDIIWIHDYHLLLVPGMIRNKLPDAQIGFFLHTAFPSSEVFRCLAVRKQLLEGMLGANMIAFQAHEYAHHFLQTCSRLLVVEATDTGVQFEDRYVCVSNYPIGVVPDQLMEHRQEPEVHEWTDTLFNKYQGKRLIVARDKLDSIRGVKQKLLGYEMFLNQNPELGKDVVLIQVATSTASEHKDLDAAVSDIVTRINAKHSTLEHQPVVFLRQDIAFLQYLALLTAADVLMVTSLREGMNLTCHEYILCQDGQGSAGRKKFGPIILSEFTGSAEIFAGAELAVNPWDFEQISRAVKYALAMKEPEKEKRYKKLASIVKHHNGAHWIESLNSQLREAYQAHQMRDTMSVPRLNMTKLSEAYKASTWRLFILDYEGTLSAWGSPKKTVLSSPQRVISAMTDLINASEQNIVYLTSGRMASELESLFGQVPKLGLVAENGCSMRPFGSDQWVELLETSPAATSEWKQGVLDLMEYSAQRIEKSWVEDKTCGLVFHYEDVSSSDLDAAQKLAGDAANHINDSCRAQRMRAIPLENKIVVEHCDISKKTAAERILETMRKLPNDLEESLAPTDNLAGYFEGARKGNKPVSDAVNETADETTLSIRSEAERPTPIITQRPPTPGRLPSPIRTPVAVKPTLSRSNSDPKDLYTGGRPDFLFVAGDDREDEAVFRWAGKLGQAYTNGVDGFGIKRVFSVCVGKRNTEANFTLTQGVTGLLTALHRLSDL